VSRRQRQLDELCELCRSGGIGRAIDLAFEHFTRFGADEVVLRLLATAVEESEVPERIRHRLAELRDTFAAA